MRRALFRKLVWATFGLALVAGLVFGLVALSDSGDRAEAQPPLFHGITILKRCDSPSKADDTTSCQTRASYADDFGDTITVHEAWDEVTSAAGIVRIPAVGNLPILSVSGNVTCAPGPALPCDLGPDPATQGPGTDAGVVTFLANEYVVQPGDPDPLPDQGTVIWQDRCDAPGTSGCNPRPDNIIQAPAATDLVHPCLEVEKRGDDISKVGDEVDYSVWVRNCSEDAEEQIDMVKDSLAGELDDCDDVVLPPGGECRIDYTYKVQPGDDTGEPGATLVNEVEILGHVVPLDNLLEPRAEWETTLVHPDFEIEKECSPDPVNVGDTITWTVTVRNTGDVTLVIDVDDPTAGISETITLAPTASETITRSRTVTAADVPAVSNTVTAIATLDPDTGLPNVIEKTAEDTCGVGKNSDVKKVDAEVIDRPAKMTVCEDVDVTVRATLHNNGPFGPVEVDIASASARPPAGCTAVLKNLPSSVTLPVSMDIAVDEVWTIHCSTAGNRVFWFDDCIEVVSPGVLDPEPENNCASAGLALIVSQLRCPPWDRDCDGYYNYYEVMLGSDPDDKNSTPEHMSAAGTCMDGLDNDKDGLTDNADPGC